MNKKSTWPCLGRPEDLKNQPIGMYHCEFCGEMQLAGTPHLPPQFPDQWEGPLPKMEEPVEAFAPVTTCPACGAGISFTREEERFSYGRAPHAVELTAIVDKGRCSTCAFEFTDWRAEEARDAAVKKYLRS